jgi:hypothetical protein
MSDDITEVAPTGLAPEQFTAWSDYRQEDSGSVSTETKPDDKRTWWMLSGYVAVLALLVVMLSVAWFVTAHSQRGSVPVTARSAPSSSVMVSPAQTVAPASVPNAAPQDRDSRFLALMATQHLAPHFMDRITEAAQWECGQIAQGEETKASAIHRIMSGPGDDITWEQAEFFVNTSVDVYCPQYGP